MSPSDPAVPPTRPPWLRHASDRSAPVLWDETLRDGEQAPGVHFTTDEKLEIAVLLDDVGCQLICAGIAATSEDERRAIRAVAGAGLEHARVLAAGRALTSDVDAIVDANAHEAAIFAPTSDLHLRYKMRKTRAEMLSMSVAAVEHARDHALPVTFVAEDASRSDLAFLVEAFNATTDAGAHRLVVCDTVGVLTPRATTWLVDELGRRGVRMPRAHWAFHNHNDLGLATANALAAFEAGVGTLSVTVNGLGERAGNASLQEVVLGLERLHGVTTGLRIERLELLSRKVEECSGVLVRGRRPPVGNARSARQFVEAVRDHYERTAGVDDATFWRIVGDVTGVHDEIRASSERRRTGAAPS